MEFKRLRETGPLNLVNSKSLVGKVFFRIKWKFELNYALYL